MYIGIYSVNVPPECDLVLKMLLVPAAAIPADFPDISSQCGKAKRRFPHTSPFAYIIYRSSIVTLLTF